MALVTPRRTIRALADKAHQLTGVFVLSALILAPVYQAYEAKVEEVSYMWPRPGADATPVEKVSFVTKAVQPIRSETRH